jgi:hypothetical protein
MKDPRKARRFFAMCVVTMSLIFFASSGDVFADPHEELWADINKFMEARNEDSPAFVRATQGYHRGSKTINEVLWKDLKGQDHHRIQSRSILRNVLEMDLEMYKKSRNTTAGLISNLIQKSFPSSLLDTVYHLARGPRLELSSEVIAYRGTARAGVLASKLKGTQFGFSSLTTDGKNVAEKFSDGLADYKARFILPAGTLVIPVLAGEHGEERELVLAPGVVLAGCSPDQKFQNRTFRPTGGAFFTAGAVYGQKEKVLNSGIPIHEIPTYVSGVSRQLKQLRQNMPKATFGGHSRNFATGFVGGYVQEAADSYGYGGTAAAVGVAADVGGALLAQGLLGGAVSVANAATGIAIAQASSGLGANDMQVQGLSRLSGALIALATGTFPVWAASTLAGDVGSILFSYQKALHYGMSSGEFWEVFKDEYPRFFWEMYEMPSWSIGPSLPEYYHSGYT